MTGVRELYKCVVCSNVVEVVYPGASALVCCGKPMDKMKAKFEDLGNEKHVPVVEPIPGGILVKVGSVEHPMEEKHFIKFIEVLTKDQVLRAELSPGQKPAAEFPVSEKDVLEVREYCNIHGLWSKN
jgi:superoxide reductase